MRTHRAQREQMRGKAGTREKSAVADSGSQAIFHEVSVCASRSQEVRRACAWEAAHRERHRRHRKRRRV